ncbi:DUF6221 family protein [Streptomyces sp. NPDC057910]|uniref:DUF6221 family protein n=1 Tax=Streptomyces sp. NPDC057910 TaxID=3346278 RepID=UPI0036E2FDBF
MDDLVQFLRDRLDEDETVAHLAAEPESWMELNRQPRADWHVQLWADPDVAAVIADPESSAYPVAATPDGMDERDAEARATHIARHDPARVLADVEAKRELLGRYEALESGVLVMTGAESILSEYRRVVLPSLALPYADHPDYREEWRP